MNLPEDVLHLLIRYQDPAGIDTVMEHENVVSEHGAVWFGKFGKKVGHQTVDRMQQQVTRGVSTYLYLTNRAGSGSLRVSRGTVAALSTDSPPASDVQLVPGYYREVMPESDVALWVRVARLEEMSEERLDALVTAGSQRPVRESLRGSSPFLVVSERGRS